MTTFYAKNYTKCRVFNIFLPILSKFRHIYYTNSILYSKTIDIAPKIQYNMSYSRRKHERRRE